MAALYVASWILLLLTASATPEIPTKGKHTRLQDAQQTSVEDADMPRFAEPIANVTVSIGRDALLACVVENLKSYKVAWVRVDTQTILSIHHNVISQNNRISLTYNDHRSWYLHIKEVEESDRGWYMCQVNTDPMRSRKGYLQVVVPPMIVEGMTSNDMVVREGLNVTLMCKARGYPEPYVMWRREDGEEMLIGGEHVNVVDGELLHITKVSRLHMAAYLCVASNGVPPSISKRVHLRVQFPPMLSIPNQLEGAYVGQDVILECHTEAYPASINYWTTERGDMIISDTSRAGDKYETTSTVSGYTKYMKLKIRSVGLNDFGTYRCVAKNSLGETDGNIKLDEMPTPTTAILSEMAMLNRSLGTMNSRKNGKHRQRSKFDLNALPDYGVEEWRDGAGNGGAGNTGDNNQPPVRNPPGAFRNSAGSLAQHNLLGGIIHWIKMQSFGIFERLSSCQPPPPAPAPHAQRALPHAHFAVAVTASPERRRRRASGGKDHEPCQATTTKATTTSATLRWRHRASWLWLCRRRAEGQRSVALILRFLLLAMPFLSTITHTTAEHDNINNNNNSSSSNPTAINTLTSTRKATTTTAQQATAATSQAANAQSTTAQQSIATTTTTTVKITTKSSDDMSKNKRTAAFAGYAPFRPKIGAAMNSNNNNNNNCTAYDYNDWQNVNNRHHDNSANHNNSHNSKINKNANNANTNNNNNSVLQIIGNIFAAHIANNMRGNVTSLQVLSLSPLPMLASLLSLSLLLLPFPLLPARQQQQSSHAQPRPQSRPQPSPLLLLLLLLLLPFMLLLLLLLLCYFICIAIFSTGSRTQVESTFFRLPALSWPLLLSSLLFLLLPAHSYFISNISTTTATTATTKRAAIFSISRNRHLQAADNNNNKSNKTLMMTMMKPPAVKPQIATRPTQTTTNTTATTVSRSNNKKSTKPTTRTTITATTQVTCSKFEFRSALAR